MTKEAEKQNIGERVKTYMGLMRQSKLRELSMGKEDIVIEANEWLTTNGHLDFIAERRLSEKTKYLLDCTVLTYNQQNKP